jgi:sporulation protein YlmC with PRC-barrel domain
LSELKQVFPINLLKGMSVLSLDSGNKIGQIGELFIDPINGVLLGVMISLPDGDVAGLSQSEIYSFGRDAVMVRTEGSISPWDESTLRGGREASKLIGTKIITESGDALGQITNVFITMKPPPRILYEARQSIIDKLLGREFFLPAAVGHALSDDATRLVVPDATVDIAVSDIAELVDKNIEVRSYDPVAERLDEDDTVIVRQDEEETIVRFGRDEDDTVLRPPRS